MPPLLPIVPLAQVPSSEPVISDTTKKLITAVVILVLIVGILYLMDGQKAPLKRNPSRLKKASTAELAKRLYDRLDGQSRASETTMRSLAQIARNR
jgi:hypothetical protein